MKFEKGFKVKMINLFVLFSLLINSSLTLAATSEEKIDKILKKYYDNGQFNGIVLVSRKGKTIYSKSHGYADIEKQTIITPRTVFRIGSLSKAFTAMGILILADRGLINLNAPISRYLPDYPETGREISAHMLLTHSSGIPDYTKMYDFTDPTTLERMAQYAPVEDIVDLFKDLPLEFEPGHSFKYSNSGYVLLSYIIQEVSGMSYEDFMNRYIFKRLGMKNSGFDRPQYKIPYKATGYTFNADYDLVPAPFIDLSNIHGTGSLYSTLSDMYRWDRALYTNRLVRSSLMERYFEPHIGEYAYAWGITSIRRPVLVRETVAWHNGRVFGFSCHMARFTKSKSSIIILGNMDKIPLKEISKKIANVIYRSKVKWAKEKK